MQILRNELKKNNFHVVHNKTGQIQDKEKSKFEIDKNK